MPDLRNERADVRGRQDQPEGTAGAGAAASTRSLIGRAGQRRQLIELWDRTVAGRSTLALVSGDAGCGKTSIVTEFAERVEKAGDFVLTGHCVDMAGEDLPYLPIIDALRSLPATEETVQVWRTAVDRWPVLADIAVYTGWADLIDERPDHQESFGTVGQPSTTAQQAGQHQLFHAVHAFLALLAAARPVLVVLEDFHWADRSSANMLAYLARTLHRNRVAVVATYRTEDVQTNHSLRPLLSELARLSSTERISLAAFDRVEMTEFLDEIDGAPVALELVVRIHRQSEGNPFFAELLLNAQRRGAPDLPAELADLVLSKVDDLPTEGQQVVRLASVANRPIDDQHLIAASPIGAAATEEGARQAVAAGLLLVQGSTYHFRHALFSEAIYGNLLPTERARLHRRFAAALAQDARPDNAAERVHHLLASDDLAAALPAAIAAAERAATMLAPAEALRHWETALELAERLNAGDRLTILRRARSAALASGQPERAQALAEQAMAEADRSGGAEARVVTRIALALQLADFGYERDGFQICRQALAIIDAELPDAVALRARALSVLGVDMLWGDPVRAAELLQDARELALQAGEIVIAAEAGLNLCLLMGRNRIEGNRDELLAAIVDALEPFLDNAEGRKARLRADLVRTWALSSAGRLSEAVELTESALARAAAWGLSDTGIGFGHLESRYRDLFALGRWDEVIAEATEAGYQMIGVARENSYFAVAVLVERRPEEAEHWIRRLRGVNDEMDYQLDALESRLQRFQHRPAQALQVAQRAWTAVMNLKHWLNFVPVAIETAAAFADVAADARIAGDVVSAASGAEGAAQVARDARAVDVGYPAIDTAAGALLWARLDAEVARAAGTDTLDTWRDLAAAADRAGRVPNRLEATWRAARRQLDAGDRGPETLRLLRAALDDAQFLQATVLLQDLQDLMRRARISLPDGISKADAAAPAAPSPLSDREMQVLQLAAAGRSNAAIGRELYISDKTVSVHVSRILGKLGAASRTEAAAIARHRGWLIDSQTAGN